MTPTISAIVIARNEADMISNCLETLKWCDEVVVVDNQSSDHTGEIAQHWGARVIEGQGDFATLRNLGLQKCKADWLLYIDADERVIPTLAKEIRAAMVDSTHSALSVSRSNVLYGHLLVHGGWNQDRVVRLFRREKLLKWSGAVHEHAEVEGTSGELKTQLLHLTHRNVIDGLIKSSHWTPIEAQLLFESGIPKVKATTIMRKGVMEVWRRIVVKRGYQDGVAGWVEALVQGINRMLVYMQVWELQQKPSLPERYQKFETQVSHLWKQNP